MTIPRLAQLQFLAFCIVSMPLRAAPWYESASFNCGDPLALRAGLLGSGWLQRKLPFSFPSAGRVYVTLQLSEYKSSSALPFDSTTLDEPRRATLRKILDQVAESSQTEAVAASLSSKLVGFVAGAGASIGPKSIFKFLQEDAESRAVGAKLVWELLAPDGRLVRLISAARDKQRHEYIYDTISYEVVVGKEPRSYILTSCYYPVKIVYSRFVTIGDLNNKVFTRMQSESWRTFDVDTQKFEGPEWEEYDRDDEYDYFKEVGSTGRYRMSFLGGKWQTGHGDGAWGTLYASVRAE